MFPKARAKSEQVRVADCASRRSGYERRGAAGARLPFLGGALGGLLYEAAAVLATESAIVKWPRRPRLARSSAGRALLAIGAFGCSAQEVDSDAIRTQGMFADMLALAPGDGTTLVRVQLAAGGENGTAVTLVGDDRLEASFAEATETLVRSGRGNYERQMAADAAGDVSVQLLRGSADANASARAWLPEPFVAALETDVSAGIARDAGIDVSWSPAEPGRTLRWTLEGRCLWTESGTTADDGALRLEPELFRVRGARSGEECEVDLRLDREGRGSVDSVWVPGSRFRAIQRRAVRFVSVPARDEDADERASGAMAPAVDAG